MAVHQVEEYYVHIDVSGKTESDIKGMTNLLIDNGWEDFEFTDTCLTVDCLEDDREARLCDEAMREYLDK
jgi:hypothetical protein